ncbi:beta strand repeat-containing protein [Granulibacter bethesdensis]|uniref:beta strand repeat-containing protein n=1 Tax=Granulibacter bethesdensis TaxID=364410 RepID=UPI0003F20280|nr:calcium-binding protein [Granulibacter bethesdensis]AHJ65036.1 Adhesin aidA-I [Granulibacter bethesdensis CGDNIH4]
MSETPTVSQGWNIYSTSSESITIPLLFHSNGQYVTPDFSQFTTTGTLNVRVRVVGLAGQAADGTLTAAPVVTVSPQVIRDTTSALVMDTGSFPTVIPLSMVQAALPTFTDAQLQTYPPGFIVYNSDNVHVNGYYVPLTLAFTDATDGNGQPLTTTVNVLVTDASSTYMMGLRFDYDSATQQNYTSANSALMNLAPMQSGAMSRGYIISQDGLTVGLNQANAGSGWAFTKLAPASQSGDWLMPPVTVTVNGQTLPAGSLLIDTGLNEMFLKYEGGSQLPANSTITLSMLGTGGAVQYSFNTGTPTGVAPSFVSAGNSSTGTFVNTGLHALAGFDVLYDEANGLFGLRANGHSPQSSVSFDPVFSLSGNMSVQAGFQSSQSILLTGPATLQGAGNISLDGTISGNGLLTVKAPGTVTLSGSNTYTGGTVLQGAAIAVSSASGLGTGGVAMAAGSANTLSLTSGSTTVWSAGADTISAGMASVRVAASGAGTLTFVGGKEASQVYGGGGTMTVFGGAGDGVFAAGGAGSVIVNGAGNATVIGGGGNAIYGGSGATLVFGGAQGANSILGGSGSSTVVGQSGDHVVGQAGNMLVFGSSNATDTIIGGNATTVMGGNAGTQLLSNGNTVFWGGSGNDMLWGGAGITIATLGSGNDTTYIGSGAMSIAGGSGQDIYTVIAGQAGGSAVIFDFNPGQDSLVLQGYDTASIVKTVQPGYVTLSLPDQTMLTFVGADPSSLPGRSIS